MTHIQIRINGEAITIATPSSLSQALDAWLTTARATDKSQYVIALNQNFVPRSQYLNTELKANDEIEMLSPMAGG